MSDLKVGLSQSGKDILFKMNGKLIEGTELPTVDVSMDAKLHIDWGDLNYINSVGIKIWVEYLSKLTKSISPAHISFSKCPPILVDQMSKVKNVIVKGIAVQSFMVPYVCLNCGHIKSILFELDHHYRAKGNGYEISSTKIVCEKCLKDMELDVTPAKYFNFLSLI